MKTAEETFARTHYEFNMIQSAYMEEVPPSETEWEVETVSCSENDIQFLDVSTRFGSDSGPFGNGIKVHLLWDMLETSSKSPCQKMVLEDDDDATTLAPTVAMDEESSWTCDDEEESVPLSESAMNDYGDDSSLDDESVLPLYLEQRLGQNTTNAVFSVRLPFEMDTR